MALSDDAAIKPTTPLRRQTHHISHHMGVQLARQLLLLKRAATQRKGRGQGGTCDESVRSCVAEVCVDALDEQTDCSMLTRSATLSKEQQTGAYYTCALGSSIVMHTRRTWQLQHGARFKIWTTPAYGRSSAAAVGHCLGRIINRQSDLQRVYASLCTPPCIAGHLAAATAGSEVRRDHASSMAHEQSCATRRSLCCSANVSDL